MNYATLPDTDGIPYYHWFNRKQKRPPPLTSRQKEEQRRILKLDQHTAGDLGVAKMIRDQRKR